MDHTMKQSRLGTRGRTRQPSGQVRANAPCGADLEAGGVHDRMPPRGSGACSQWNEVRAAARPDPTHMQGGACAPQPAAICGESAAPGTSPYRVGSWRYSRRMTGTDVGGITPNSVAISVT